MRTKKSFLQPADIGFFAQFDCHSTVKHTFFLACLFQSKVAGLDAVISKTSNVSVCFHSNFAWDNLISCGIPQTKHILILPDTFCDLNEKDKINTGLAFSIVISLSVFGYTIAFAWQVFSCSKGPLCISSTWVYLLPPFSYLWPSSVYREASSTCPRFTLIQCSHSMALLSHCCCCTFSLLNGRSGANRRQVLLLPYPLQDGIEHGRVSQAGTGWVTGLSQILKKIEKNGLAEPLQTLSGVICLWDNERLWMCSVFMGSAVCCPQVLLSCYKHLWLTLLVDGYSQRWPLPILKVSFLHEIKELSMTEDKGNSWQIFQPVVIISQWQLVYPE